MSLGSAFYRFLNPPIKESLDELPAGIYCYWPGGLVKLKNRAMEALSFALTGEALADGENFWSLLTEGAGAGEFLQTGSSPVVRLADGTVRAFSRRARELDGSLLYIITTIDLTEAYERNAELKEKQQRTAEMVERQRALNLEIGGMIREREILSLKTRIHDDLSRALLSGRQYLARPDGADRAELIRFWNQSLKILRQAGADEWRDSFENARETARALGLELAVEGEIPEEPRARDLISAALICCLSNALRHAGADTVALSIGEDTCSYSAEIKNNGAPPVGSIAESGSLADLRRQIELAGGRMTVQSAPRFALILNIPKEEKDNGI